MRSTTLALIAALCAAPCTAQEEPKDVADVPNVERQAQGDPNKTYFLIGHDPEKKKPKKGYKLLLILPGGGGGRDFNAFCRRIHKNVLGDEKDYVSAQLVSKSWTEDQQIVWPTDESRVDEMEFTTEQFIDAVIEDIESELEINRSHIFTLSWSSSGPAAYAAALRKKSRITGSFVAMSVFKPKSLPKLSNAKKRAFYIYHSEQDKVCPMRMARDAEKKLTKAKAKVEFATYDGGHGWRGDVFGNMKRGIEWLAKNHSKAAKVKKSKKKAKASKEDQRDR